MLHAQGLTVLTLLASLRKDCHGSINQKIKSDGPHFISGEVEHFRMHLYRTLIEEKSYPVNYKLLIVIPILPHCNNIKTDGGAAYYQQSLQVDHRVTGCVDLNSTSIKLSGPH